MACMNILVEMAKIFTRWFIEMALATQQSRCTKHPHKISRGGLLKWLV
jgi:hypothetical protein